MAKQESSKKQAVVDMAKALRDVFKGYTRHARGDAWKKLVAPEGKREMDKLVQDPFRPLNMFQKMTFKEWIDQEEEQFDPEDFFGKIERYIFTHMRAEQGRVNFHFPNYQMLIVPSLLLKKPHEPVSQPTPQTTLAAHAQYTHPLISEEDTLKYAGIGTSKWSGATKALRQVTDPGWQPAQWNAFEKIIKSKIRKIASLMGFLFEIEIYLYLEHQKHVKNRDDEELGQANNAMGIEENRDKYMSEIKSKLGSERQANQIYLMVMSHAKDLAEKIFSKTQKTLKCTPDQIVFTGGNVGDFKERKNPADITLLCSGIIDGTHSLGWNIKLTSEGRINMAMLSPLRTYELLGGKNPRRFTSALEHGMSNASETSYYTDFRNTIIPLLSKTSEENIDGNPQKFVKILNWLIAGNHDIKNPVALAVRHYASSAMGGAEWSSSLKRDFNIQGLQLKPKEGAEVHVVSNSTYVKLTYKHPEGSSAGTSILFEPRSDKVIIKVSNLTREKQ